MYGINGNFDLPVEELRIKRTPNQANQIRPFVRESSIKTSEFGFNPPPSAPGQIRKGLTTYISTYVYLPSLDQSQIKTTVLFSFRLGHSKSRSSKKVNIFSSLSLIIMLAAIFEVFPSRTDTYKPLFWQDASSKTASIDTTSIQSNCMLVLLKTSICIVAK